MSDVIVWSASVLLIDSGVSVLFRRIAVSLNHLDIGVSCTLSASTSPLLVPWRGQAAQDCSIAAMRASNHYLVNRRQEGEDRGVHLHLLAIVHGTTTFS